MDTRLTLAATFLGLLVPVCRGDAQGQTPPAHVALELLCDHQTAAPGSTVTVALKLTIDAGWHVYWNGLNDSGSPIEPVLNLPKGWTMDHWRWPTPVRHVAPGDILDHIYEEQAVLLTQVSVPKDAEPGGKAELTVDASWLVCKNVCIPEEGSARVGVSVDEPARKNIGAIPFFKGAALKMPRAWPSDDRVSAAWDGATLSIRAKDAASIAFFPSEVGPAPIELIKDGEAKGAELALRFKPSTPDAAKPPARTSPRGIVDIRRKSGSWESYWLEFGRDSKPVVHAGAVDHPEDTAKAPRGEPGPEPKKGT